MAGGGPDWRAAGRTVAEAEAAAAAAARDAAMALDEALSLKPTDLRFTGAAGLAHAMVGDRARAEELLAAVLAATNRSSSSSSSSSSSNTETEEDESLHMYI
eukprot:COSAG02_NODE_31106_length_539_cov_0.856818_1_plen_101_part_10